MRDSKGDVETKTDEVPEEMETEKGHEVENEAMISEEPGQQSAGAAAASGLSEAQRQEGREAQKRLGEWAAQIKRRAKSNEDKRKLDADAVRKRSLDRNDAPNTQLGPQ